MKKDFKLRKLNNKGIALISIMIAVAFITIIASALLAITYSNFQMKVMNLNSKENFYETDGQVSKIMTGIRQTVNGSVATAPETSILNLCVAGSTAPTVDHPVQYDMSKVAALGYTDWPSMMLDPGTTTTYQQSITNPTTHRTDTFTYKSNYTGAEGSVAGMVTVEEVDSAKKYTFHDMEVQQKTSDGYMNTIKTDIVITTVKVNSDGKVGGVGDFSMMSDNTLSVAGTQFTSLDIYGSTFFAKYNGIENNYTKSDGSTGSFTKPGGEALVLNKECKMNVIGEYLVVYGDVVLNDKSCLYIGNGNMTVYGDIIINDGATLICNGKIFMVDEPLPGRMQASQIKVQNGSIEDHVFPKGLTIQKLTKANYESVCATLATNDADENNDGITNKILKPITNFNNSGHDFDVLNYTGNINSGIKNETKYFGQPTGIAFNTQSTINGDYKNFVVFNLNSDAVIRQPNPGSTFISKNPISVDQLHSVSITKVGDATFSFLTGVDSGDTSNPLYDSKVHDMQISPSDTSTYGNNNGFKVSAKDFFASDCNATVKKLLLQSVGGGSGADVYYSSISMINYKKD